MILNSVIRSVKTGMFPEAMMSGGTVRTEPDVKSTRKWNTWDRNLLSTDSMEIPKLGVAGSTLVAGFNFFTVNPIFFPHNHEMRAPNRDTLR